MHVWRGMEYQGKRKRIIRGRNALKLREVYGYPTWTPSYSCVFYVV